MNRTSNWKLALDVAKNLWLPVFPCREQDSEFAVNGKIRKMPSHASLIGGLLSKIRDLE